jgi:osmoprotectant transport system substrate-binding protein
VIRRSSLTRTIALIGATLAAALTMTACGGSSDPLSTASSSASSASSSAAPASATSSAASAATSASGASSASASAGGAASGPIVVGSANFPESALIANMYAAALTAKGVEASTQLNIGERAVYLRALQDGSVDLVPEYTGVLLQYFDPTATATSSDEVYAALQAAVPEGLTVLEPSDAENKDSITVTRAAADENNLTSIADLAPVAGEFVLGGPPEFATRPTGVPGLQEKYGITFGEFRPLDVGGPLTVAALAGGQIQAANLFTTDPAIPANDFVVLEDPNNLFAAQNVVPLINADKATPDVQEALNAVSAALTTETLTQLLTRVTVDKEDSAQVAQEWVAANVS